MLRSALKASWVKAQASRYISGRTSILLRLPLHGTVTPTTAPLTFLLQRSAGRFYLLDTRDEALGRKGTSATRAVLESVSRTASNWLQSEVTFFNGMTACPPGAVCTVSEKDMLLLHNKDPQLVDDLTSRLAANGSHILIISQSIASSQPDFC